MHLSDFNQIGSKKINQFGYNKLENEKVITFKNGKSNLPRRSLSYTQLKSLGDNWKDDKSNDDMVTKDGVLIDLSDELTVNFSTAQEIMTETHKAMSSMSQIDTNEQQKEEPTYCNVPINESNTTVSPNETFKYYSPPCESSDGSLNQEQFTSKGRYYSSVASNYQFEESQSQTNSLNTTSLPIFSNPSNIDSLNLFSGQQYNKTAEKRDRAFDWLENKVNEIRLAHSPKPSFSDNFSSQESKFDNFFDENKSKIKLENKLSKEFIDELESKFIKPINEIKATNGFHNTTKPIKPIPLLQPPPKTNYTNRRTSNAIPNTSDTLFATVSLPPKPVTHSTHNNLMTNILSDSTNFSSLPSNTAHVKPFLVTPTAPSRETIYGMGVTANSIPGASQPLNMESPQSLVSRLQNRVKSATFDECIAALYRHNMDAIKALKELQLSQLMKLGISSQFECEKALSLANYDMELAADHLLDRLSVK